MPSEGFETCECARRKSTLPAAQHEVGDDVGHPDQNDEIAEGHDLVGERERNGVAEPRGDGVVVGDGAWPIEDDALDVVGIEHAGFDQGVTSHRRGAVERDRNQIGDDANADHRHPHQQEVADAERERSDESRQRPPSRLGQFETVDGHPDAHRDEEQRKRRNAGACNGAQPTPPSDADGESDENGQNQGRESHGGILLVVPADRRRG